MFYLTQFQLHFRILVTTNDHLSISLGLGFDQSIDVDSNSSKMEDSEGEGGKRPHIITGNTPHKPEDKRRRSTGSTGSVPSRNAKRLSFPRSPANVVSTLNPK